jgi:hypothetical protein
VKLYRADTYVATLVQSVAAAKRMATVPVPTLTSGSVGNGFSVHVATVGGDTILVSNDFSIWGATCPFGLVAKDNGVGQRCVPCKVEQYFQGICRACPSGMVGRGVGGVGIESCSVAVQDHLALFRRTVGRVIGLVIRSRSRLPLVPTFARFKRFCVQIYLHSSRPFTFLLVVFR